MKNSRFNTRHLNFVLVIFFILFGGGTSVFAQGITVDHSCTDITLIPTAAIQQAKTTLHIGYGHTSHGSQLATGMNGLIAFANNGGLGLAHPHDIFVWNNGGTNSALDLEEGDGYGNGWLDHDCGYFPSWINETRSYLDDPAHSDVNVIIWSWCGQAAGRSEQKMIATYLAPMTQLEADYPSVTFVYMTGHADGSGNTGNLHLRNQQIRNYCIAHNKVLYDFYDIECYDPDGTYFGDKDVEDNCSYDGGNWALEWQSTHTEGVDWYHCESAHSQPLNANQKAFAAWWLWARLAGWNPLTQVQPLQDINQTGFQLFQNYPNPFNPETHIQFSVFEKCQVTMNVYTIHGKLVANVVSDEYSPGDYDISFNGADLSSGLYFYRFQAGRFSDVKKMTLLK
ncbi:T9SS type A sorting domain-containing protein [bacterium]|nr:T9SS type A sorting domain-containing protein [bacterium]